MSLSCFGISCPTIFDLAKQREELLDFNKKIESEDIWQKPDEAKIILADAKNKEDEINYWEGIKKNIDNLKEEKELLESMKNDNDTDYQNNISKWEKEVRNILLKLKEKESLLFFAGPHDRSDVVLTIKSGAGGTDAQDWAGMLLRMYLRYFERKGLAVNIIDKSPGKEAGIKGAELQVKGNFAYGYLKGEHGIHRLVRLSPFNVAKSRETSFASVEAVPLVPDIKLDFSDKDLKIDTFRAGGPGGQHVNTTSSAVRITHVPTNITVVCQNERSQMQNKQLALQILKAKVFLKQEEDRQDKITNLRGEHKEAAFG
ncbi:MAG: PCRF domain-containing protein, partial [Candidatus Moraniibacteriota bacterium]